MKHSELMKKFNNNGWWIKREGGNHTIITNGIECEPIPRHREINERLAKAILKKYNIEG